MNKDTIRAFLAMLLGGVSYSCVYVEASVFDRSSASWNFGWFAVVADEPRGTMLMVR